MIRYEVMYVPKNGGKGEDDFGKTLFSGVFDLFPEDVAEKLINDWEPQGCKTEKDYENSLYDFFKKKLNKKIIKQFGLGRVKADIAIGKKVVIELKRNFKTTAQYQRLIGQIEEYKGEFDTIFVVICGDKIDRNLVDDVKRKYEDMFNLVQTIKVIVK